LTIDRSKGEKEENIDEMVNSWIQRLEELLPHVTREPAVGKIGIRTAFS